MYAAATRARGSREPSTGKRTRLEAAAHEVWDRSGAVVVVYIAWDEEVGAIVAAGLPWAFSRGAPLARPAASVSGGHARDGDRPRRRGARRPHADDLVCADVTAAGRVVLRNKRGGTWTELASAPLPGGLPPAACASGSSPAGRRSPSRCGASRRSPRTGAARD